MTSENQVREMKLFEALQVILSGALLIATLAYAWDRTNYERDPYAGRSPRLANERRRERTDHSFVDTSKTHRRGNRDEYPRQQREGSRAVQATGPVHTFVKTDENAHFKWGVRHHVR